MDESSWTSTHKKSHFEVSSFSLHTKSDTLASGAISGGTGAKTT